VLHEVLFQIWSAPMLISKPAYPEPPIKVDPKLPSPTRNIALSATQRHAPIAATQRQIPVTGTQRHMPVTGTQRHMPVTATQRHAPVPARPANSDPNAIINIIVTSLVVAVLLNIALTLYVSRSRESAAIVTSSGKEAELIDEMIHIRAELVQNRVALANSAAEIGRMKVAYATVVAQVGGATAPHPSHYSSSSPEESLNGAALKPSQPNATQSGDQIK
jgi:hypothetical protein